MFNGAAMHVLHMNDYPAQPPREKITDAERVYPGDGVAPVVQILRDLHASGFRGMLSLELFNRELWKQDPFAVARTGLEKMKALVAKARLADAEEAAGVSLQTFEKAKPQEFAWGWIRWLMNAQIDPKAEMTLGIVHVQPNQSNPLHVHPNSAEYLHMLSGACEHRVGNRWVPLKTGDTLRVPRGVPHMARTKGEPFRALIVYDTGTRQMVPVTEGTPPS
jgi:quercetin dioxygenase-like cupin family protein